MLPRSAFPGERSHRAADEYSKGADLPAWVVVKNGGSTIKVHAKQLCARDDEQTVGILRNERMRAN